MTDCIRTGIVSSVSGNTLRVLYPDRQNKVTIEMPWLVPGVTRPPKVGEIVVVLHPENGKGAGICLGGLSTSYPPSETIVVQSLLQEVDALRRRIEQLGG